MTYHCVIRGDFNALILIERAKNSGAWGGMHHTKAEYNSPPSPDGEVGFDLFADDADAALKKLHEIAADLDDYSVAVVQYKAPTK